MQDLMPPIDTSDKVFHDGNPAIGELGTIVPAKWLNNVQGAVRNLQSELLTVLGSAEMASDPVKKDQLKQAISKIYAPLESPVLSGVPTAPTAARFDVSQQLATTEFVQHAIGSMSGFSTYISGPVTLTAAQAGNHIVLSGTPGTCTLPALSTVPVGTVFQFKQECNGRWTIASAGVDNAALVYNNTSVGTISLKKENTLQVVSSGNAWRTYGTGLLPYDENFGASLGTNGFQKLPSGMVIQWGGGTTNASGYVNVVFPLAFSSFYAINATHLGTGPVTVIEVYNTRSNTGTVLRAFNSSDQVAANWACYWIAVGRIL